MNQIKITGLNGRPQAIECVVQVQGNPDLSDPAAHQDVLTLNSLSAVSPDGQWMALKRQRPGNDQGVYTIARTHIGAEEVIVPLGSGWRHVCARGIANDGTLLFEAQLNTAQGDYGYSKRPLLFQPGSKTPLILPPPYIKPEHILLRDRNNRPLSHAPDCYAPDGTIFGWTNSKNQGLETRNTPHCVWRKQPSAWVVEYLPAFFNNKQVWPGHNGTFVWADYPSEDRTIHFGLFGGTASTTFRVTLNGQLAKIVAVAADSTFIGCYRVMGGTSEASWYTYLVRPHNDSVRVFNSAKGSNPWLKKLSSNGKYVAGEYPGKGYFILKAEGDGYCYAILTTPGWCIEDLCHVTDEGQVFVSATCIERQHSYFRLKLPVLLTPQW